MVGYENNNAKTATKHRKLMIGYFNNLPNESHLPPAVIHLVYHYIITYIHYILLMELQRSKRREHERTSLGCRYLKDVEMKETEE